VWSSPSYNGNEIFIGSDDGFLYCLDIDGRLIWKTKLNGKVRSSSPCLSFDEDQSSSLFIGTYNGGMFCLNTSTGVIKWNKLISKPVMASPATIKDKVFAASDKRIYCFQNLENRSVKFVLQLLYLWSCFSLYLIHLLSIYRSKEHFCLN
jgi:outer membrane protein assembly factor BamB